MHNFVAFILWSSSMALFLVACYLVRLSRSVYQQAPIGVQGDGFAIPFGVAGVFLTFSGGLLSFFWPLTPGSANIYIGYPTLFFGALLIAAALLLVQRKRLHVVALLTPFPGVMTVVIGITMLVFHIGRPLTFEFGGQGVLADFITMLWPGLYFIIGVSAICAPLLFWGPLARSARAIWLGACLLGLGSLGMLFQACIAQISHIGLFLR